MKTTYLPDNLSSDEPPCVATVGFFDGVHRGHCFLISQVVEEAKASGMSSLVVTFDRHPRQVLKDDYQPELLTTLDNKLVFLSKTGIDHVVVLHFDGEMARMSACDFMEKVLSRQLNVRKLLVGYDNRFGHGRQDGFNDYVRFGNQMGMEVIQGKDLLVEGRNVSSSAIRHFIRQGEMEIANHLLGYPYIIMGKVVGGMQEGRKMGFPTANIDLSETCQLIPAPGAYAVRVRLPQSVAMRPAMMNIGTRPTFGGSSLSVEVHIFQFDEDLYGQQLYVSVEKRIREERKFDSVNQLREQLKMDRQMVMQTLDMNH
ncbi:MAG: bifunctional riboflavin kinase/FAD synthetase [Prevotella sp.]|nr:bifunctional riboflavin kinase/FAD synthetase [Prevotella sp.]